MEAFTAPCLELAGDTFCGTDMSVLSADRRKFRSSLWGALSSTMRLREVPATATVCGLIVIVRASSGCFSPPLNTDSKPECCSCVAMVFDRMSAISSILQYTSQWSKCA